VVVLSVFVCSECIFVYCRDEFERMLIAEGKARVGQRLGERKLEDSDNRTVTSFIFLVYH